MNTERHIKDGLLRIGKVPDTLPETVVTRYAGYAALPTIQKALTPRVSWGSFIFLFPAVQGDQEETVTQSCRPCAVIRNAAANKRVTFKAAYLVPG